MPLKISEKTCLLYYKLDPAHCLTSPGLSWDAMLKMTDIKLKLMNGVDMFQFVEKGMRGGTNNTLLTGMGKQITSTCKIRINQKRLNI